MRHPLRRSLALLVLTLGSPALAAEPVPVGPAFEVHAERRVDDPVTGLFLEGFCCVPRMAGDTDGNVFLTWTGDPSQEGLFAQKFDEAGTEVTPVLRLNGFVTEDEVYDDYASRGAIGADAGGNFIVAWVDDSEIDEQYGYHTKMRRLSPSGGFVTEKVLAVNSGELNAAVAVDEAGAFLVAWVDAYQYSVMAQRGVGNALKGAPIAVSTTPLDGGTRTGPEVAVDGLGQWIVTWESPYEYALRAQILDQNLVPVGGELSITTGLPALPTAGSVVPLDAGGFIVTWLDYYDSYGGLARHVDPSGNLGAPFPIGPPAAQEVAAARVDDSRFVVVWYEYAVDFSVDVLVQLYENDGTPEGSPFVVDSEAEGGHYAYLAATGRGDGLFAVAWDGYEQAVGTECVDPERCGLMSRWFALSEEPEAQLLPGRTLLLTNRVPDNPAKSRAKWLVKDDGIAGIARGGLSDPRCLFDPEGTVKATIRFVSPTSGHDTGEIPLPCQNWESFGPSPQQSWKYRDKGLADGPCDQVVLKAGKSLKVTCRGKPGAAIFPYDLEPGVSEGPVDVALIIGSKSYCTTFPPLGPFDGQDGKRFLGKNAPPPGSCAGPP